MSAPLRHLRGAVLQRAETNPTDIAFVEGEQHLTYSELAQRATDRSVDLYEQGVRPGDRVALIMQAGLSFCEVFWALQLIGAAPASFNPSLRPETLDRLVAGIRPTLVVHGNPAPARPGAAVPAPEADPETFAFLQPTSGTSGSPRAAMVRHRNVLALLESSMIAGHVERDDVMIAWVPPWHDLGLVRFVIGSVFYGARCHVIQPAIHTIPDMMRAFAEHGGTISGAPDFWFRLTPRMVPGDLDLSSLRYITNGGEPVRRSSVELFEQHFGVRDITQPGYGLAEATLGVTSHPVGEPIHTDDRGHVSCGTALPGVEVVAGASADEPDEIRVRGDIVFAGYLDAPEDTAAALRDGWLHTGDVGYLDGDGRLYVLGRRASLIKRGGAAIAPREIEEAAGAVPDTLIVAAVGVPAGDHDAVAVVVGAFPTPERPADAIAADVSRSVADRLGFAPHQVTVVEPRAIPMTANGKIRHGRLRDALASGRI